MADFTIQRGVIVVTGTELTKTITAGTEYTAPSATSKAFIRIVAHAAMGSGTSLSDFAGTTYRNTWEINNPSNLLTSITFERSDQSSDPHRIHWEIIEYVGAASGANEFIVRHEESLAFTNTDTSKSTASISGISTEADVCVFLTSAQSDENSRRGVLECMYTTSISSGVATITRGYATNVGNASLAVVEFTGSNWTVQRISHAFSTADTEENETITSVGDLAKTFLETQGMVTVDANDGKYLGYASWLSTTTNLKFKKYALTAGTDTGVTWVISNSQSGTGAMNVAHKSGTTTVSGDPFSLAVSISTTVGLSEIGLGGFCANPTSDAGTDNHLYMLGAYVTSTSNVQLESGRDRETRDYYFDVIEWPTESASSPQTLNNDFISSGNAIHEPTLSAGAVILTNDFITGISTTYEPILSSVVTLSADYIPTGNSLFEPSVIPGLTIDAGFIASTTVLYEPYGVVFDFISSTAVVYEPVVSVGTAALTLTADYISTGNSVYEPTVSAGAVSLSNDFLTGTSIIYEPVVSVAAGPQALTVDYIISGNSLFEPTVSTPSVQNIVVGFISSTSLLYEPNVSLPGDASSTGGYDEDEEETIKNARYMALKLAIHDYYGISEDIL